MVETRFGLSLAARTMSDSVIRELKARRFDVKARTQSIQIPGGGSLRDLDVELESDFVFGLAGQMEDLGLETEDDKLNLGIATHGAIIAGDSIIFQASVDLNSIEHVLSEFLRVVQETPPSESFAFVDALEPLKQLDDRVARLEGVLMAMLILDPGQSDNLDSSANGLLLTLAPPDNVSMTDIATLRFVKNSSTEETKDVSLAAAVASCRQFKGQLSTKDLRRIHVEAYDGDDGLLGGTSQTLIYWLVAEIPMDGKRFILSMGKWYALDDGFIAKLDADLASLPDLTDTLQLPPWRPGPDGKHHETQYNRDQVVGAEWATLDTVDLRSDGDEIEACDQFHRDGHLVHIKRFGASQKLSALFAQGSVSAETLVDDEKYKASFVQEVELQRPDFGDAARQVPQSVVFAIALQRDRPIPQSLPTFSKVNLRSHCRRVRRLKAEPAVAKVMMVP